MHDRKLCNALYWNKIRLHEKSSLMQHYDLLNLSALEYNKSIKLRLNELVRPLHQYGIYMFNFVRTFYDGKRLYLSTDAKWVEHYINHNFQDNLEHMNYYLAPPDIKYSYWISVKRDEIFESIYEFGVDHGFTIFDHHSDHVDQFGFSTYRDKATLTDFYVKNIHIFEEFVREFKTHSADLMALEGRNKLIIPSKEFNIASLSHSAFPNQEKINSFLDEIKNHSPEKNK